MGVKNDLTLPNMRGFLRKGLSALRDFAQSTTSGQDNLALIDQLERIEELTKKQMETDSIFQLLSSATEELGELSVAVRHESGYRDKVLKEPAFIEAIDLMICAINMYFATGGKIADLTLIMESKLDKWERLC